MQTPENQTRVRKVLDRLVAEKPQVLLLEGGTGSEREALALYWASLLNCTCGQGVCGTCNSCIQVRDKVHVDLKICDGLEEKIKIDDVRALKPLFGQPPRGDGKRVVIFNEAQELTTKAANALLKSLEEPCQGTVFVLLTPQREWLLPTLVSRSWVLTLAWPGAPAADPELDEWLLGLLDFWRTGKGWFKRTSAKGAVDRDLAMRLILACQRAVACVLSGQGADGSAMAQSLAKLPLDRLKRVELCLAHAQDALSTATPVNPVLVADWLATHGFGAVRGR